LRAVTWRFFRKLLDFDKTWTLGNQPKETGTEQRDFLYMVLWRYWFRSDQRGGAFCRNQSKRETFENAAGQQEIECCGNPTGTGS
jgi:hypothetical protein